MAFAFTPTLAMNTAEKTARKLHDLADADRAAILQRFFKTGPGQYGQGDRFLGVVVPLTRAVVRNHRHEAQITDVDALTASPWHEIRLAGFLMLIEIYRRHGTAAGIPRQSCRGNAAHHAPLRHRAPPRHSTPPLPHPPSHEDEERLNEIFLYQQTRSRTSDAMPNTRPATAIE